MWAQAVGPPFALPLHPMIPTLWGWAVATEHYAFGMLNSPLEGCYQKIVK